MKYLKHHFFKVQDIFIYDNIEKYLKVELYHSMSKKKWENVELNG